MRPLRNSKRREPDLWTLNVDCAATSKHTRADFDDLMERTGLLTPREREVFDLLAPGLSTSEIASALGIHASTVKVHTRAILAKLDTDRRAAGLAALLIHHGRCPERTSPRLADSASVHGNAR